MNHIQIDKDQLERMGITYDQLEEQIRLISQGTEKIKLHAAATLGSGILPLGAIQPFVDSYNHPAEVLEIVKFVPASGAATRMFKDLLNFYNSGNPNAVSEAFLSQLARFPFYPALQQVFGEAIDTSNPDHAKRILEILFYDSAFSFLNLPKGLVPFHRVEGEVRTAFEEHYREAAGYQGENRNVCMHFTVALEHRDRIAETLEKVKDSMDEDPISLKFSLQSMATNTVALNAYDEIVRDEKGRMVFRPGGHGSLLENLNNIHADIIFIRNIDNITPVLSKKDPLSYERVMAGYLLHIKAKRDKLLLSLERDPSNKNHQEAALQFIKNELQYTAPQYVEGTDVVTYIQKCLDRPMRICGMVKNEGEPGGGPYQVMSNGDLNLQIVESSQMDATDPQQQEIIQSATHFNPVDIVCATRNHRGEKYDLMQYRDVKTSFVASKTYQGKNIKALEWPGLWNGAMADWLTFFVEIPLEAFNPVKTINDLLRAGHVGLS